MGLLSRSASTGLVIVDKYLGDALYAAMVYAILRLRAGPGPAGTGAVVIMTALELFQLTMIPARLFASEHWLPRIIGRLLGVQFRFLDLVAYGVGIGCLYLGERAWRRSVS